MPFRQYLNFFKNKKCHFALQAQRQNPQLLKSHHNKKSFSLIAGGRVCFFISGKEVKASVTVEAAWLSVIFLTVFLALSSFFQLFQLENRLQREMEAISDQAVLFSRVKEALDESISWEEEVYELLGDVIFTGVSASSAEAQLETAVAELKDGGLCEVGSLRVDPLMLYDQPGVVDLVVRYETELPLWGRQSRVLRSRKSLWQGNVLEEDGPEVYVTVTGSVYHTGEECSHLKLRIKDVSFSQVGTYRNEGGGKYTPCELCVEGEISETVCITEEGSRYHESRTCSGLKRSILKVKLSRIGEKPLCSRCEKREAS